jgi:hypothetical protein
MFARLSPLSCPLGRLPLDASLPQGVRIRRSKLLDVDCTIKKTKGKRPHEAPSKSLDVVSKCQTWACGSMELSRPKKNKKWINMKIFQICQKRHDFCINYVFPYFGHFCNARMMYSYGVLSVLVHALVFLGQWIHTLPKILSSNINWMNVLKLLAKVDNYSSGF